METKDYKKYLDLVKRIEKTKLDVVDTIGIATVLILSKDFFLKNSDIDRFIQQVFNIKYSNYIFNSRTLIVGRINRDIYCMDEDEIRKLNKAIVSYVDNMLKEVAVNQREDGSLKKENTLKNRPNKKKNENEKLKVWLKGL